MTLDLEAKKVLLRKIPHGLFICGVTDGNEINGFTASWVTQGSFDPPLIVMAVRAEGKSHEIIEKSKLPEVLSLTGYRAHFHSDKLSAIFVVPYSRSSKI